VETLRHNTAVSAALTGITASVAGVIANLAFSFAEHTLFEQTFAWAWAAVHRAGPRARHGQPGCAGHHDSALVGVPVAIAENPTDMGLTCMDELWARCPMIAGRQQHRWILLHC
jgi:chromate transporter